MSVLPPPRLLALFRHPHRTWLGWALLATLPLVLQPLGLHWVRVADVCLLYVLLALGMNVVVGFAGLLDLGFVAFYAVGAYLMALMTSPHLPQHVAWAQAWFPGGMHAPWWLTLPAAATLAALAGMLLGLPTLKLRGDYLAVVTLGFGEIVRILIVNLYHPVNVTDGAQGIGFIDPLRIGGWSLNTPASVGGLRLEPVTLHYYLFLALVLLSVGVCLRLQRSRIGRAWMAIREDEMAAQAMGLHTRNLKLLAFAVGAAMGGVGGALFGAFQGFVSPEAFSLQESVMIVAMVVFGGMGHVPGVILGAVLLSALPEALRYVVGPLQVWSDGRLDAGVLRPALIGVVMVVTMLVRPRGLWPSPHTAASGGVAAGVRSTSPAGDRAPRP